MLVSTLVILGVSTPTALAQGVTHVDIGALVPQTGRADNAGEHRTYATELAVSDFNAYLNEKGATWQLRLTIRDTGADPTTTLAAARLFDTDGIQYLSGPSSSGNLNAIREFLNDNDMLTISCCSTAPSLAISDDNVFRLAPDDTYHGPAIANLVYSAGKRHMLAIHLDDNFGRGLQESTTMAFTELGGTASVVGTYDKCDTTGCYDAAFDTLISDLADAVDDLSDDGVQTDEMILLFIGFGETVDFLKKVSEHPELGDSGIQWVGSDAVISALNRVTDSDLLQFLTDSTFRSCIFAADTTSERFQNLESRFEAQFPDDLPSVYAYSSYDSVWVLGLAIENAGGPDATFADVKAQIRPTAASYTGALGDITLNAFGDFEGSSYAVWGMIDSQWQRIGTYVPDRGFVPLSTASDSSRSDMEYKIRPTFGKSHTTNLQIVSCGYSMDGQCRDVLDYHVDYERETIQTGSMHNFTLKAFAPNDLTRFLIGFGVEGVGAPMSSAEAVIIVKVSRNYSSLHDYVIDEIHYIDENNVIGRDAGFEVGVESCMPGSMNQCVQLGISDLLFREQMYHEPFAIEAVDRELRTVINYMNTGLLIQGESMNPAPMTTSGILKTSNQVDAVHITLTRIDKLSDVWQDQFGHTWSKNSFGTWYYVDGPEFNAVPVCRDPDNRICPTFAQKYDAHTQNMAALRDGLFDGVYGAKFASLHDPVPSYDVDVDSRTTFLIENDMMWVRD